MNQNIIAYCRNLFGSVRFSFFNNFLFFYNPNKIIMNASEINRIIINMIWHVRLTKLHMFRYVERHVTKRE